MKAPFEGGSLLAYPETRLVRRPDGLGYDHLDPEMREAEPFYARLRLVDFERGRSAARFVWEDEDRNSFPMFLVDMLATVQSCELIDGQTEMVRWAVVKRGGNYGIRPERAL